jgi:hypothetical protein
MLPGHTGHRGIVWTVAGLGSAVVLTLLCGCLEGLQLTDSEAYDLSMERWQAAAEQWPTLSVRIVNNTAVTAEVILEAAGLAPASPWTYSLDPRYTACYEAAETQGIIVAPGGTATGTLACGDVVVISAFAPYAGVNTAGTFGFSTGGEYWSLAPANGNIPLTGAGIAGGADFTGDIVTLVRYVRPVEDGLDCATNTLVVTITADSAEADTGALGAGVVSIE